MRGRKKVEEGWVIYVRVVPLQPDPPTPPAVGKECQGHGEGITLLCTSPEVGSIVLASLGLAAKTRTPEPHPPSLAGNRYPKKKKKKFPLIATLIYS